MFHLTRPALRYFSEPIHFGFYTIGNKYTKIFCKQAPISLLTCPLTTSTSLKHEPKFNYLIDDGALSSSLLQKSSKMKPEIAKILQQYEYELYRTVYESFEEIPLHLSNFNDKIFCLHLSELNDCLQAQGEQRNRIIRRIAKRKCMKLLTKQNATETLRIKKLNESNETTENLTGIWNLQDQLSYGLWKNSLFIKFGISCASRLFERRLFSSTRLVDAPRVILDLDYVPQLDYFQMQTMVTQISDLFYINKYHCDYPFNVEFYESDKTSSTEFDEALSRKYLHWNQPDKGFQYVRHRKQSIAELCPNPQSIIYINQTAACPLTTEEILNPEHIFVLPVYPVKSLRLATFTEINSKMASLGVKIRRIPTNEHIVWSSFHGVIPLPNVFQILHDIRHDTGADWKTVLRRHLTGMIKSEEDLIDLEKVIQERNKRRVQSMKNPSSYKRSIRIL